MRKLPLELPYISTIPEHSNIMAIVGRSNPNWLWFLNYFIQLRINKDVRNKLCLNFCYGHNYKLVKDIPILETYSLPRDILRMYDGFGNFLRKAVDRGYYIYVSVDRYEIKPYEEYKEVHKNHDLLVYGYEEDLFFIADFFGVHYSMESCSAEELERGYQGFEFYRGDGFGFDEIILLKEDKSYKHVWNIHMARTLVEEYLKGSNSDIHFLPVNRTGYFEDTQAYGINIYEPIRAYLKSHIGGNAQVRSFHMLYEHKRMLLELLNYLSDNLYLLHSDENIELMEEIVGDGLVLRNLSLKYTMTHKSDYMIAMLEKIDEMEQKERRLFTDLTSDICCTPQNRICENTKSRGSGKDIVWKDGLISYIFKGNEAKVCIEPKEIDRKIKISRDGKWEEYCLEAGEKEIKISRFSYGYHWLALENVSACEIGLLSIECRTWEGQGAENCCAAEEADSETKGNWMRAYGSEGYHIFGYEDKLPVSVRIAYTGFGDKIWKLSDKNNKGQALAASDGKEIAACKYFRKNGTVDIVAAGKEQRVSFYVMDCYQFLRKMRISAYDADTEELLDVREVKVINTGIYVRYRLKGHIRFDFQNMGDEFGCISGIFIDKTSTDGR